MPDEDNDQTDSNGMTEQDWQGVVDTLENALCDALEDKAADEN